MGSITKPESIVGENLIRRSHKRKDVKQTEADATPCKQSETRHRDNSFSFRSITTQIKCGEGIQRPCHERQDIKSVFNNELFNQCGSCGMDEVID